MRKSPWNSFRLSSVWLLSILVLCAGGWWLGYHWHDFPPAARAEGAAADTQVDARIGVIDLPAVMQRIPELRAELTELQSDVQRAQSQFQKRQSELLSLQKELQTLSPESQEFQQRQQTLQQQMSQLQTEMQLQQQQFFERERKAYLSALGRIDEAVQKVARAKGLVIVLKQSRPPAATSNPQELLSYLAREVIWAEPQLDITDDVIRELLGPVQK
ncbi:MAG: OmpH family outer membrane protein [Thermogutta sp.]|uniref:OmpH family outer membrane protein n=1 Tax=Thermogutta sp. TaxID=1962930 RepID=UPI0019856C58|nr:OmpH family outer membrane protein [Thermogutta sp.]MBC7353170.1 OmpH family outer membrane protein [Thermogutta sp.]